MDKFILAHGQFNFVQLNWIFSRRVHFAHPEDKLLLSGIKLPNCPYSPMPNMSGGVHEQHCLVGSHIWLNTMGIKVS